MKDNPPVTGYPELFFAAEAAGGRFGFLFASGSSPALLILQPAWRSRVLKTCPRAVVNISPIRPLSRVRRVLVRL